MAATSTGRSSSRAKPARSKASSRRSTKAEAAPKTRRRAAEPEVKKSRSRAAPEGKTRDATKSSRSKVDAPHDNSEAEALWNPMADIDAQLDSIEKDYTLSGSSLNPDEVRQHTGTLTIDLLLSRGIVPGWYTFFGPEQSCKSTGATTAMSAGLDSEIPILAYFDFEGSTDPNYLSNIIAHQTRGRGMDIKHVFGIRGDDGSWIIKPRVRYYSEGVAEKFFDYLASLERRLPDKVCINKVWYYVYENTKANKALVGDRYDKKYLSKTGKLRVPAKDGTLQAMVIVDSYPAMLPERLDVDDPGSGMAAQARMFSEQLRRVKGKMKAKRIAVIGVNQLRKAPAVMFGNPEYEPGGEALKFFSDVRLRQFPRALSAVPGGAKGKGMIEEEPSIDGGTDSYRYIHVRAHKNKLGVPNLEGWLRLWITDSQGEAQGFDPVWDVWRYLVETGQAEGKRSSMKLKLEGKPTKKGLTWIQFKQLVLGDKKQRGEICTLLGLKLFDIRRWCIKQLHEGNGMQMYLEQSRNSKKDEDDEDDE